MLIGLAVLFVVAWGFGYFMFHAMGSLIHLLLVFAAISLVFHFLRGGSPTMHKG